MMTDTIADLLTRIRNAQRAGHKIVQVRFSKMNERILVVLQREGFIDGYEAKKADTIAALSYSVFLKYYNSGKPMISLARRVSKPGRRNYAKVRKLPRVHSGLGIAVVSTSQGLMSDREAQRKKIGGEVLALIG